MPFNKIATWAAVVGALVMLGGAAAQAKGPKGGGHGASPTFTRGTPQAQTNGKSGWSTSPPGWSKAEEPKGWDSSRPRGWGQNTLGQKHGWDGGTASPGIQKRSGSPAVAE